MNREALASFTKAPTEAWRRLLEIIEQLKSFLLSSRSKIQDSLLRSKSPIDFLAENLTGSKDPKDLGLITMKAKINALEEKLIPQIYRNGPQYQLHFSGFKEWKFEEILRELQSILLQEQSPQKSQYYRLRALLDVALEGDPNKFRWSLED